ncbi:UDP-glucose dehydrogenase [hydrothermal vent metagenome]|uniref:UDP-glucose dehydrogenase n=1 Tax=hydrothermal vent metagenome TaxID=652676 RepID=A0A3B0VIA0_9ZZZZ
MKHYKVAVIGLGYVGLPLAVAFTKHYNTIGYDISTSRIAELKQNKDSTLEITTQELQATKGLSFTTKLTDIATANIYIITVPTPVDANNLPELSPLKNASVAIGSILTKGDIVVYESTVFPGATEEYCAKILEKQSGLTLHQDFALGYSPERINPGDKVHTLQTITKVVAASDKKTELLLEQLYSKIIDAGVFIAASIKVAEAAKAVENTQRDINIAFMNELAIMFNHMGVDTLDVIKTASTKWNFLAFTPGLVGGHCIGVDPYYLIHKSQESGYYPQLITTGRRINESMSKYVVDRFLKKLALSKIHIVNAKILILGLTFKENCPDLRNTRVVEIIDELQKCHANVDVYDPWADASQAKEFFEIDLQQTMETKYYDAIILAVAHTEFMQLGVTGVRNLLNDSGIIFDIKGMFPSKSVDERL